MESNDIQVLVAMFLYLVVTIVISVWYAKRANTNSDEYFLGGRSLGPWITAMSAEASDMSGWLLMGLPGVAYFFGASDAVWTAIGLLAGTYLSWKLVAVRLRKYSTVADNAITLPDFFSNRFHDNKRILMSIAAFIILFFFSIYVGSCFVTCGKLFNALFGFDYVSMMIVGAIFVFVYTLIGGFLAESTTDFMQGILMIFALVIVTVGGLIYVGGFDNVVANLKEIPGFLSLTSIANPTLDAKGVQEVVKGVLSYGDPGTYGIISILSCLAWGLGYFGMPHVVLRFMASRSTKELPKSRRIAVTWCAISLFSAVAIGLIGKAMLPDMFLTAASAESIFITMSTLLLPPFVAGIVVSGILAATMSSSDSYMLIASSAIAKNFYLGLFKKDATDKQVMWAGRITMVVLLILGIWIAADQNSSIFSIVAYAWAGFGACFGPLMIASLYWRRVNFQGALAGMITGGVAVVVWRLLIKPLGGVFGVYELLPAFILASLAIIIVSLLTTPPSEEICKEFDTYMDYDDAVEREVSTEAVA
ncbi:MAG: sodium/proline symporter PutP [Actinobacteria bacterium]|nr:sodium/proline symporter PutP [Actinomycetota bacterium]